MNECREVSSLQILHVYNFESNSFQRLRSGGWDDVRCAVTVTIRYVDIYTLETCQ